MNHQVQNDGHGTEEAAATTISCRNPVLRGSNSITEALRNHSCLKTEHDCIIKRQTSMLGINSKWYI